MSDKIQMEVTPHSTAWALLMMEQGESVRRNHYKDGQYQKLNNDGVVVDELNFTFFPTMNSNDWSIYTGWVKGNFLKAVLAVCDGGASSLNDHFLEVDDDHGILLRKKEAKCNLHAPTSHEILSKEWVIYENSN